MLRLKTPLAVTKLTLRVSASPGLSIPAIVSLLSLLDRYYIVLPCLDKVLMCRLISPFAPPWQQPRTLLSLHNIVLFEGRLEEIFEDIIGPMSMSYFCDRSWLWCLESFVEVFNEVSIGVSNNILIEVFNQVSIEVFNEAFIQVAVWGGITSKSRSTSARARFMTARELLLMPKPFLASEPEWLHAWILSSHPWSPVVGYGSPTQFWSISQEWKVALTSALFLRHEASVSVELVTLLISAIDIASMIPPYLPHLTQWS